MMTWLTAATDMAYHCHKHMLTWLTAATNMAYRCHRHMLTWLTAATDTAATDIQTQDMQSAHVRP